LFDALSPGGLVSRALRSIAAFLLYLAVAVVLTYPLVLSPSCVVPHDPGDPLLNVWLLSWNASHVPFSSSWWNGPFFHPLSGSLAFSEHLVGLGPLASPVLWLGGSPLFAYNLAFLLSFPLCGLGAYWLSRSLSGAEDAAVVGGLMFAFAPYRIAHLSHVDVLSCYWMPLCLLGLHRYVKTRRARWLGLFAASWLLQVLCKGYSFFHFSVLLVLWLLWFAPPWREWRTAARIAVVWALAALPLVPVFLTYRAVHERYGLQRAPSEIEAFSADVASVLDGSPLLAHWHSLFGGGQEMWLFPGIAPVLTVAVAGFLALRRPGAEPRGRSKARLVLAALGALAALVALSAVVLGPWRLEWGPLKLSVKALDKPLGLAWLFLIAAALTSPRFVAAHRRRSAFAFYAAATLAMWLLSLGPAPRAFGTRIWYKAPYWWLLQLPGFASLRVPARFWICAVLCLAVAATLGLAFLAGRLRRGRLALVAGVGLAVLWDGWITALPLVPPPERSLLLEAREAGADPVLELPLGGLADAAALYRSIFHRRPIVNGYSGHEPPHYAVLRLGLERWDPTVLTALAERGPLAVAVARGADPEGAWARWVEAHPGVTRVGSDTRESVYLLTGRAPAASPSLARRLPIQGVRANVDPDGAPRLIDGDRRSRWTTGARQRGGERIVLDLGSSQRIQAVVLSLGPFVRDFPRELRIEVSPDSSVWTEVWRGPTGGLALAGSLLDPMEIPLTFPLTAAEGRFIRLRQTAEDPLYHWSVAEVAVWGGL
jgi:hypothetical protein